jgi:putative hydroxymethylpyrimidine transport system ATP-binding protein
MSDSLPSSASPQVPPAALDPAPAVGVRVRGARLAFDGKPLFDTLDADFPGGATICLLGPSGVGKTSLLRVIAGLESSATANVCGSDGATLAGRTAYMAQNDLLLPWSSALGNVLLGPRLRREKPGRERALALLGAVGLAANTTDRPAALSGGMRQRVALARTLMEDRPVVLMDEPFASLDALTRYRLQDLAADLLQHRTVILVTHDPVEALRLGHRIHVLAGRPVQLDQPIVVDGAPPRDPTGAQLNAMHRDLLDRLGQAARASGEFAAGSTQAAAGGWR